MMVMMMAEDRLRVLIQCLQRRGQFGLADLSVAIGVDLAERAGDRLALRRRRRAAAGEGLFDLGHAERAITARIDRRDDLGCLGRARLLLR